MSNTVVDTPSKVYLNTEGKYYLAGIARNSSDSYIPSPSPALISLLNSAAKELQVTEIGYQLAWDATLHAADLPALPAATLTTTDTQTKLDL